MFQVEIKSLENSLSMISNGCFVQDTQKGRIIGRETEKNWSFIDDFT